MDEKGVDILVIEDNTDDAKLVEMVFQKYQILEFSKIHIVKNGIEALEYLFGSLDADGFLLSHYPTLIFLDLNLPKMNGLDLLRKIKSHHEAKKIPIIILTSSTKKDDWEIAYSLGADKYVLKPGDFNEFIEAVGWALLECC